MTALAIMWLVFMFIVWFGDPVSRIATALEGIHRELKEQRSQIGGAAIPKELEEGP